MFREHLTGALGYTRQRPHILQTDGPLSLGERLLFIEDAVKERLINPWYPSDLGVYHIEDPTTL